MLKGYEKAAHFKRLMNIWWGNLEKKQRR